MISYYSTILSLLLVICLPDDEVDKFVSVLFDNKVCFIIINNKFYNKCFKLNEVKTQLDNPDTQLVELRDTKVKYGKKYQYEFSSKHDNLTSSALRKVIQPFKGLCRCEKANF